jgi:hypothetical protein
MYKLRPAGAWRHPARAALALAAVVAASVVPARAQSAAPNVFPVPYVLTPESRYEEGCFAPCECPILLADGVKGGFALSFNTFQPPFIVYDVRDILWSVPTLSKTFTGSGKYLIGWKGTAQQQLQIDLSENGAAPVRFDSGLVPVTVPFPLIDVAISEHGFFCYDKAFYLKAAPGRPISMGVQVDSSDVSWDMFPDSPAYDAVFGSVSVLRQTGGGFTAATAGCLARDVVSSPAYGALDPPVGEVYWYLVRGYGGVAGTTYDAGDPGAGTRDAQINASPLACP